MAGGEARAWPVIPVGERELRVFNPRSNIALCVNNGLATGKSPDLLGEFTDRLPRTSLDKVNAAGVLTVIDRGVQLLLANLLANPAIDTLILAGRETLFKPSSALLLLKESGFDSATREILGYAEQVPMGRKNRPFVGPVPDEALRLFRSDVRIVDARLVNQSLPEYFAQLVRVIDEHYRPVQAAGILRPFDFSALQPEQKPLPRYAEVPVAFHGFRVFRSGSEVFVEARAGDETVAVVATDQDSLVHGVNAWAVEAGLSARVGDEAWFSLGREIARAFTGGTPAGEPSAGARLVKGHVRKLDLDPIGYYEVVADPLARAVKCLYVPADPKGRRFELLARPGANHPEDLLRYTQENRLLAAYDQYPGRAGHLAYLGAELEKAFASAGEGYVYVQDKPLHTGVRINTTRLYGPAYVSAPSLPDLWRSALFHLERDGRHSADPEKGEVAEGWCTLWHTPLDSLRMPDDFEFFEESTARLYAKSLFEANTTGESYTYGDRQCHFFAYDQVRRAAERLRADPARAAVCQRYYPPVDLPKRHGLPCLLGESYFLHEGRLHAVHCVRAHDLFRAFPENLYGIGNGWAARVAREAGAEAGDLLGLSINNNYRKGSDRSAVEQLMKKLTVEPPRYDVPKVVPRLERIESLDALSSALAGLPAGPSVLGLHFPDPSVLASLPASEGRWPVRGRLRASVPFNLPGRAPLDQVEAAGAWLHERPTDNGCVLSPRDPVLDREREVTNLVFVQPRVHLGRLVTGVFSVNTTVRDGSLEASYDSSSLESAALQYRLAYEVHARVAELAGVPPGDVFVLHAPLWRVA